MVAVGMLENASRVLADQRISLKPIDLAEEMRPSNEAEAYQVQSEVNRRLAQGRLGKPVGHKIGCTTTVMQAFLGIPSPCAGDVFEATVFRGSGQVSRTAYRKLGVECEIVVGLGRDLTPEEGPFRRETIVNAVNSIMAGIEIVDDRYRDYRSLGVPTLIADNFFNAGCVLGEPVKDSARLDLCRLEGRMMINNREVGRGNGAMVLGDPLEALVWLANSRAKRGLGLECGRFVFLGSLIETKWLSAGDDVRIEIEALGTVSLTVLD